MSSGRIGLHLTQPLHRAARQTPGRIATVDGDRVRTWREVQARAQGLAGVLMRLGVGPGDRVGLLARNGDVFLDFLFGALWVGGVVNPVNTRWSSAEIAYSLADCGTTVLLVDPEFHPLLGAVRALAPCLRHVLSTGPGGAGDMLDLEAEIAAGAPVRETLRHGEDLAAILYTGGTTGAPKGVMLSHRALMAYALCLAGSGESAPGACMLHTAPLHHVGALSGLLAGLLNETRHVFVPAFAPQAVMEAVQRNGVTDLFLVPTMLQAVLDHPTFGGYDLTSIERILYGAAPITPALMDRAIAAMPRVGFVQGYGMTETASAVTLLKPSDHRVDGEGDHHLRSAGRAIAAVEVKIVDPEDRELAPGEVGEIVARGETVMTGYWNRPRESAAVLRDGWMHTGDLGRMDTEGYVTVVDRLKDMIVTGGENVFSVEVEGALARHPAVAMCAVVGRPDERWGEAVHAVIVPTPGAVVTGDELAAHCRAMIAGYKCPRTFEFRDQLPLSATGKILKSELRASIIGGSMGRPQA